MINDSAWFSKVWDHPRVADGRLLLYAVTPNETSFKTLKEVPNYTNKSIPYFIVLIAVETLLNAVKGHKDRLPRWDDAFSSMAAGVLSLLPLLVAKNFELVVYIWFHENLAVYVLDWDNPCTWLLAMLGVDFGYYWAHRFSHEVNFMWAAHQAHHSSEDYNFTTALRQSVILRYHAWIFYLPMALFIPPPQYLVHQQFNLVYQFWVHTQVIGSLGPLEWVLNTPSHHRVHHGRNRYCIDKNYGGTLIVWDRLFGTFAAEKKSEEIAYGLVHPLNSWDPIYTQFCHWKYMICKSCSMNGLKAKLSVFLKGPGWDTGKPRLGHLTDIPNIKGPTSRYSRKLSLWLNFYCFLHFVLSFVAMVAVQKINQSESAEVYLLVIALIVWTIVNVGYFYEQRRYSAASELLRCCTVIAAASCLLDTTDMSPSVLYPLLVSLKGFYTISMVTMLALLIQQLKPKKKVS